MAAFTATYVIQAPIDTIQSYIDAQTKQSISIRTSPNFNLTKAFFEFLHTLVIDLQSDVFRLTQEEANNIWKTIEQEIKVMPEIEKSIRSIIPIHQEEKNLLLIIKSLNNNLKQLIKDINFIANRPEIDELSDDYSNYFGTMISNALNDNSNTRILGKQKLYALFED